MERDIRQFESLFQHLQPRLIAFCCKYTDDKELAQDFVQECFISLWENYESVNSSLESYLFAAVKNRCLSHFSSLKIHAEYETSIRLRLKEIETHPETPDPLIEIYLQEVNTLLRQTIEKLPEKCKQIFMMSRYQGMKNQAIAMSLGISVRTVEAHIYNALKIFKKKLRDYLPISTLFFYLFSK
jgi:RNA polymerase sigma-70 factor (ECF subfamily)